MTKHLLLACALCVASPAMADQNVPTTGWTVSQTGRDFTFDTSIGAATSKGVRRDGLVSVTKRAGREAISWWQEGAYRPTISVDGEVLVDGLDIDDVSRVSGFRMDRAGSYVRLAINKGPNARVRLIKDGAVALEWPRLQIVSVLSYDRNWLVVANFDKQRQHTEFLRYPRDARGEILETPERIGALSDCAMLSAKVLKTGIALQVFCDPALGSDIHFLDYGTGLIKPVLATAADEVFAFSLDRTKDVIPVLSIRGDNNARHAFHALTGALLSGLGEPMARGSDEAGKLSWGESYRIRVLGQMYRKTGHPVFAELASGAMRSVLRQQNSAKDINGAFNPDCAWASRIYSTDRRAPVSFMINQAMISSALLQVSVDLGAAIDPGLRTDILENARCLVRSYEPLFDEAAGLYRIPYGAPFRYDGVWAPWNWHLAWAPVLEHVGLNSDEPGLVARAHAIAAAFADSWTLDATGALWRYWVPAYYEGWTPDQRVSLNRPAQKPAAPRRYEDINHAGISLLGLSGLNYQLDAAHTDAVRYTLDRLLAEGSVLPRDLDGNGPRSPRWLPGAGWHAFATERFSDLYSHLLPGAVGSDQHLAYAQLFDPEQKFDLRLDLSACTDAGCRTTRRWSFQSVDDFIADNPLFSIEPSVRRSADKAGG